jgi:hypothetical protein
VTFAADLWDRFWYEPVSASSICMFRIFFALLSVINALLYLPDFLVWFGDGGAAPLEVVSAYRPTVVRQALLWLHPSDRFYLLLIWLEIAASLLVLLGWRTKASLIVLWLVRLLLFHRNPALWHQVDILLRIYGTVLLFCPAGEMYSVDAVIRRRKDPSALPRLYPPWGQRLIQIKLSLIYGEAFLGKIVALFWLNGSAVYFATHFPDGARHPIPAFMDRLWVYQTLTYFTLAVEFSLFILIWVPRLRYPVLLAGTLFHLGIHWFLNLDLLEFGAMIAYLCFVAPRDMERAVSWAAGQLGGSDRLRGRSAGSKGAPPPGSEEEPHE